MQISVLKHVTNKNYTITAEAGKALCCCEQENLKIISDLSLKERKMRRPNASEENF
jgi:hypothetical protein